MFTPKSLIASIGMTTLLLTGVGCVGTADAFAKRAAKFACINAEECSDEFGFDSQSDCRDDVEDTIKEGHTQLEELGCEYVAKEGRKCIREARKNKKECGESDSDACNDVWDCPEGDAPGLERDQDEPGYAPLAEDSEDEILPESALLDGLLHR